MTNTEFLLAYWDNLRVVMVFATVIAVCISLVAFIIRVNVRDNWDMCYDRVKEGAKKPAFLPVLSASFFVVAIVTSLIAALPTANDLWHVRIALVKYELASKENLDKAVDHIDTLGKALECKYLGQNCPHPERDDRR